MMQAKVFYSLTSALTILSWMAAGVRSVAINHKPIQSRQAPTPGQVITGGQATFFFQGGEGACGQVHADSDFIVALSGAIFSSSLCGQQVQIANTQNQTVTTTIADECPSCKAQSLDLSVGAFNQIDSGHPGAGAVPIQWTLL